MSSPICAIILAAGTSIRMGTLKQLLQLGDMPILEHVIRLTLRERFEEIITVIGNESGAIKERIEIEDPRFRWVINEEYLAGQSTSLKAGILNMRTECHQAMVFLGDTPFITPETINCIYINGEEKSKKIRESFVVRPTYEGTAGHPVFFGNVNETDFSRLQGDTGAKSLINNTSNLSLIEVQDSGILFDVDTPQDFSRAHKMFEILSVV